MIKNKILVLSITRNDCEWTYFKSSGPGGQNRNKNATGVKVRHPASKAIGQATESKSQWQNRRTAWKRMAESKEMQNWLRFQSGHHLVSDDQIRKEVERLMDSNNIRVEVKENGIWKTI